MLAISLTLLDIAACSRNKSLSGRKKWFWKQNSYAWLNPHREIPANSNYLVKKILKHNKIHHFFKRFWKWHSAHGTVSVLFKATGLLCYFLISLKVEPFPTGKTQKRKNEEIILRAALFWAQSGRKKALHSKFFTQVVSLLLFPGWCLFYGLCHFTSLSISVFFIYRIKEILAELSFMRQCKTGLREELRSLTQPSFVCWDVLVFMGWEQALQVSWQPLHANSPHWTGLVTYK